MRKILILASNPRRDLSLDREIRDLKSMVERSTSQDQLTVDIALAVRPGDLQDLLFRSKPQIVHFCGHGTGETGLVFEDDNGQEQLIKTEALSDLFRLFAQRGVECVLLNACYSEVQANAIVNHIRYVVGMNQQIRDDAAIAFSTGFYRALAYDCPISEAFEFGCNAIRLQLSGSVGVRKLEAVSQVETIAIPEHLKPTLKQQFGQVAAIDPQHRPQLIQDVDQALAEEEKLKAYRDRVREFLDNRQLSQIEKIRLKQLQQKLELSSQIADRILSEEWQPIRQAQQTYRDLLTELVAAGYYPFNREIQTELQQLQVEYGLTDTEVIEISNPILAAAQVQQLSFAVVSLDAAGQITHQLSKQAAAWIKHLTDEMTLELMLIPAGSFDMGSPQSEIGRSTEESPKHLVEVSALAVSRYPITQAQWRVVALWPAVELDLNPDPAHFKAENRPIEQISWSEAVEFCQRLARQFGQPYRLPSEAEWEYACRAGTTTPFHFGQTITTAVANYNGNYTYAAEPVSGCHQSTLPVNHFPIANAFGLSDLHGNVWEWCADHWHPNYNGAPIDGSAWILGGDATRRVLRGGSWYHDPGDCRSAYRVGSKASYKDKGIGFRVVCSQL